MAGDIGFIELGVQDPERGRQFYGEMFGWSFEPGPAGQGFTFTAGGTPGGMHGGDPEAVPYVFFVVDDLDQALEQVRALGGSVEEMDVEGDEDSQAQFGRFKLCRDDQGSRFGLHQRPST